MATNLEAFITDIEQGLKQLLLNHKSSSITKKAQRTELTYQDQSYLLEVRQVPSQDLRYKNSHTSFALSKRNWIQSMLHHDVVICFYKRNSKPSNNSTTILDINGNKIGNMGPTMTSNHNMNHVQSINIMSAFTIAVKAVMDFMSVHLPVLYAYDIFHENNMGVTEVTVGFYQKNNKSNNENDDERGQQASSNTKKKHNTSMNHMEDFSDSGDEPNPNNPHDSAENSPKQPQDQPQQRRKQKPEQYRYECYLYDDVSKHKSLFFFDGIRKLYLKKMAAINAASGRVLLDDNFHIIATNYYDYEMNAWNKARAQLTSQARAFHGTSHLESLFSSPIIAFLNENYSLESFKGYNLIHLSNIQVQLDYRERIQQSVLDNESYSTFVAARQPHQHYHLVPSFTFSKMAYAYGNDLQGLVVQKLHPSSSSSPKSPALHGGGHRPVGKVVSTASSSSVGDKSSGKASEHAQSSHAPHIPSSSAATAALEQRAIAVLESIAWRSQNLRKFLTLFISSSLQVFKTYELSEGMSTMEQGDSVPKDIISSILNSLSEESRKILTTSSDYQSYLQSYSHITATLTSSKQPRALGSNISLNNINIANISTSSLSSLPAAPVAPASDAAPSIQPPELSFGYSNSPKPSDEGREEREQELLQHLMMHLFHAPLQQQQPPDEPHPAAAPSATTTSASASPLPSYHAGDMKHFLQQFVLLLSFAPMPRLATILRAWQHILRELQEMIDTAVSCECLFHLLV